MKTKIAKTSTAKTFPIGTAVKVFMGMVGKTRFTTGRSTWQSGIVSGHVVRKGGKKKEAIVQFGILPGQREKIVDFSDLEYQD